MPIALRPDLTKLNPLVCKKFDKWIHYEIEQKTKKITEDDIKSHIKSKW